MPELVVADVRTWRPKGVSCVISDPPYITEDALDLYAALADFAIDVLPDGGALVAMTDTARLPDVLRAMERDQLVYRDVVHWAFAAQARARDFKRQTFPCWKPVIVYHKGDWADADWIRPEVKSAAANIGDLHPWQQDVVGFEQLVQYFSRPGDLVADPFLGSGTTAVAALKNARRFTGADIDADAVAGARERLLSDRGRP